MTRTASASFEQALALYNDGDYARSRELSLEALAVNPQDPNLLRLAGKAGLELGLPDAAEYLEQAADLDPENPDALRDLADARLAAGRVDDAARTIHRAIELRPEDVASLVDLAHLEYAAGRPETALGYLQTVLEREPDNVAALKALVGVYRDTGDADRALACARKIVAYTLSDVEAAIDVAHLCLALGRLDEAHDAFVYLRNVDDEPDHEVYAYHGLIETELQRERWRAALDLAIDATRIDRYGRTTDVLAFVVAQVFGASDRPTPSRRDVDDALAASRAEHRRLHASLGL